MPQFSKTSQEKLSTCHKDLQKLFNEVVKNYNCAIIEGYRSEADQLKAFNEGKSKIKTDGKHNKNPSLAIDAAPYPVDWNDKIRFYHFIGYVKATADHLGIKIRCGGDWDGDNDLKDQTFFDLPHFELVNE
jgi:peptidoglycan L-alanyl-D-glutamate endopeptidase CwlK